MTRNEIEQKLWADQYQWGMLESEDRSIACEVADAAVEQFRKRYPAAPAADDRLGRVAIEAMDAILGVMGDEDQSNQHRALAIDRIATQYVAARWHIQKEGGK